MNCPKCGSKMEYVSEKEEYCGIMYATGIYYYECSRCGYYCDDRYDE